MKTFEENYIGAVVPTLLKEGVYKNKMAVPKFQKVVISTGVGSVKDEAKKKAIIQSLAAITGSAVSSRAAKISIASFKLREGEIIGYAVTLRGKRMYDFLTRLINVTIPRIRDFRGLDQKIVDAMGNMTIGFKDHTVFPEAAEQDVRSAFGLAVTIVTSAKTAREARDLFVKSGFPFGKEETKGLPVAKSNLGAKK